MTKKIFSEGDTAVSFAELKQTADYHKKHFTNDILKSEFFPVIQVAHKGSLYVIARSAEATSLACHCEDRRSYISRLSLRGAMKPPLSPVIARSNEVATWQSPKPQITMKTYFVYILTNKYNTVLYTGITNDLERRVNEHKRKTNNGFTSQYNVNKLVYFEQTSDVLSAIAREKQIKSWSRKKKNELIESKNPEWNDLFK